LAAFDAAVDKGGIVAGGVVAAGGGTGRR
jgi:hypothetical protein